jgi:hypothetical protein
LCRFNPKKVNNKVHESKLINELEDYVPIPNKDIIDKIDYFMTPYNREIIFNKHMSFDEYEHGLSSGTYHYYP